MSVCTCSAFSLSVVSVDVCSLLSDVVCALQSDLSLFNSWLRLFSVYIHVVYIERQKIHIHFMLKHIFT